MAIFSSIFLFKYFFHDLFKFLFYVIFFGFFKFDFVFVGRMRPIQQAQKFLIIPTKYKNKEKLNWKGLEGNVEEDKKKNFRLKRDDRIKFLYFIVDRRRSKVAFEEKSFRLKRKDRIKLLYFIGDRRRSEVALDKIIQLNIISVFC